MRLHHTLTLSPQPGETPASYCSRVARKHGRTAHQFAADCGTDFQSIVDGDSLALATLFEACGADQAHFVSSTVRRTGDRLFSIGNEQLTRDTMKRAELRACPECLAEDQRGPDGNLAAYMRAEWLVEAIRVCPRHGRRLEPLATDSQREIHDFAWHLQRRENAQASAAVPESRVSGGLIAYVMDRLAGRAAPQWPDQMPLYAAIKSAEIVGAAINHGIHASWNSLSDDDWHAAGMAGYEVLSGGPDVIRHYFGRVQQIHAGNQSSWGAKVIFGKLYEFLGHRNQDVAYEPLRTLLRAHILASFAIPAGEVVLGRKLDRRHLHSIHSASRETGLHPKPLRRKLLALGIVGTLADHLSDHRVVFEAEGAINVLGLLGSSMSLKGAADYLNIPRPHDRTVLAPPFITPVQVPSPRGGHRLAFPRHALDELLTKLVAKVSQEQADAGEYVWLAQASKQCVTPLLDILTLLFDGKLTQIRLDPLERGFKAILVNLDEVRGHLHAKRTSLSLRDVEHRLKASTQVVKALVDRGYLPSMLEVNPISNLPSRVVLPEDIDAFMETYVSLMGLARERGLHFRALKSQLDVAGIVPAFEPEAVPATFYLRGGLDSGGD